MHLPYDRVASLVDETGNFFASLKKFSKLADIEHIRLGINAQIERALDLKLNVSHIDNHMTALTGEWASNEIRAVFYQAAERYKIPAINYPRTSSATASPRLVSAYSPLHGGDILTRIMICEFPTL